MNKPNNVCIEKQEIADGDGGSEIVYAVVTRYNFSPEPLGGQQPDPILFRCPTLAEAVTEARAAEHFNHDLTLCCSFSLAKRSECDGLTVWGA